MKLSPVLRSLDVFMLAILIGVVIWTFKVKHDSEVALDHVADLERKIEAEEIEIDLLRSDWSLLTSPARLEKLVERYGEQLELQSMEPSQLADKNALPPFRPPFDPNGEATDPSFANTDSSLTTGGINKSLSREEQ